MLYIMILSSHAYFILKGNKLKCLKVVELYYALGLIFFIRNLNKNIFCIFSFIWILMPHTNIELIVFKMSKQKLPFLN